MTDLAQLLPWLVVVALGAAAGLWRLFAAGAARKDAAALDRAVERQRAARVDEARVVETKAVEAARTEAETKKTTPALDFMNGLRRKGPPGAGVLLLVLALEAPARAEEPPPCEVTRPGWAECPIARLELARDAVADAQEAEAVAVARAVRAEAELVAERDAAALRRCPEPADPLPVALGAAGVAAVVAFVVGFVLGAR